MPFVDMDKKREYSRKHKQKIRKKLLETIGNKCIFCHRALNQLSKLNDKNLAKFLCYLIVHKGLNRAKQYYDLREVCKQWFDLFGKLEE